MSKFSQRLKELKKEKNYTNEDISKAIGVSSKTVYRWEKGLFDIKSKDLYNLAKFFVVSSDYLIGLED